jgi:hypothetical protein
MLPDALYTSKTLGMPAESELVEHMECTHRSSVRTSAGVTKVCTCRPHPHHVRISFFLHRRELPQRKFDVGSRVNFSIGNPYSEITASPLDLNERMMALPRLSQRVFSIGLHLIWLIMP